MKTAIVTGVTGGIGKATALLFASKGYRIIGMGRRKSLDPDAFEKIDLTYISGNIEDKTDREKLITAAKKAGRIDALINVAGIAPDERKDLLEMREESFDKVMNINLKGMLFLTQEISKMMINQEMTDGVKGNIVNVSSCSAYTSSINRGEYCISKAGVSMLTMLFADRLSGEHISVNEICPGIIETDMTKSVKEKYDKLITEGFIPMQRWGQPADVAKAILSLCDGTFGYTTGQSISVDGGMHIRKL